MKKALISPKQHPQLTGKGGFDFSGAMPHVWWQYSHSGLRYVKGDLLCWSTDPTYIVPKVSEDGMWLFVHNKIPTSFLDVTRIVAYYRAGGVAAFAHGINPMDIADTMCQNARDVFQGIKDIMDGEDVKPVVIIKLPFKCIQVFNDPYIAAQGHCIRNHGHERQPDTHIAAVAAATAAGNPPPLAPQRYCVFHVHLQSADVAHECVSNTGEDDIDF